MSNIVNELRAWPARGDGSDGMSSHTVGGIMEAAADEIERLKSQLATATDILGRYRSLPVGGYGQLLGSGDVDEAADNFLETQ
jgi:hypothetical protein